MSARARVLIKMCAREVPNCALICAIVQSCENIVCQTEKSVSLSVKRTRAGARIPQTHVTWTNGERVHV